MVDASLSPPLCCALCGTCGVCSLLTDKGDVGSVVGRVDIGFAGPGGAPPRDDPYVVALAQLRLSSAIMHTELVRRRQVGMSAVTLRVCAYIVCMFACLCLALCLPLCLPLVCHCARFWSIVVQSVALLLVQLRRALDT